MMLAGLAEGIALMAFFSQVMMRELDPGEEGHAINR